MKILLIRKGGLHRLKSNYEEDKKIVTVYDSGKNAKSLFFILSHELGHHNFQIRYEQMPLRRKIIALILGEHEMSASMQEGRTVTIENG